MLLPDGQVVYTGRCPRLEDMEENPEDMLLDARRSGQRPGVDVVRSNHGRTSAMDRWRLSTALTRNLGQVPRRDYVSIERSTEKPSVRSK